MPPKGGRELAQQAYRYDGRRARQEKPRLKVRQGGGRAPISRLETLKRVSLLAVMLALVCSVLYSQAQLSELTMDIQEYQSKLATAQSGHNYLSGQLSSKTNMKNVEETATGQLGLVKLDPAQVTYFTLENESKVDKPESGAQKIAGWLEAGLKSLTENLVS